MERIQYKTEVIIEHSGETSLITRGKGDQTDGRYSQDYTEETSYRYPSKEKLRETLVKEKFHADVFWVVGKLLTPLGIISYFVGPEIALGAGSIRAGMMATLPLLTAGPIIENSRKNGYAYKRRVDSRVAAFNRTFGDLKPVSFSPLDYFSTLKLPFRR